ncbi:putative fad-dependent oxidoreductase-like enzyme [Erysiphe neolycopersici]|uniref:Putative fad-dependent oxidoreductase-like enzyme n=1 Tax=Erysiphe neolycopersici TaxID=212602 RepID=A0A420I6X9_9PEZI|nr:putative fad-dependent oxidoreductase-like enzyme [Erysiphe neolycopersici]
MIDTDDKRKNLLLCLMMNIQSSSSLTLAGPQPLGHSQLSSQSSKPSCPGPSSPIMYSANLALTPNTFSITPPPSSCQHATQSTEPTSLASSPSLVVDMKINPVESSAMSARPTPDLIQTATKAQLQEMLKIALNENLKLEAASCEARMSAAHHKLHYNLLSIESQEALNRMEVENYMIRREVSIFRQNPQDLAQIEYRKMLKGYCEYLKEENIALRYRLKKAKRLVKYQDIKLASAHQGIDLLQERIQQNRRHINDMRRPGGPLFHVSTIVGRAETPKECLANFHHNLTQNASQFLQNTSEVTSEDREKLDALLLAGSLLNQKNNNISSHRPTSAKQLHDRDLQASCHLNSSDSFQNSNVLLSPIQLSLETEKNLQCHSRTLSQLHELRRKSRDSTISVSDIEELTSFYTNENKVSESDLGISEIDSSCSRNEENSSIEQEKLCKSEYEFNHTQSDIAVTKRRRDEKLPNCNIGSKKARYNEEFGLTNS